jgi:hypothetical protein
MGDDGGRTRDREEATVAGQASKQVSREEIQRRGRYSLTIAALFLLILMGGGLPLPQRAIVIVPLGVAVFASVREIRRLSKVPATAFTRFGPAIALGLSGLLLVGAVTQVVFYGPQKAYEDCMTGANTSTAQAVCNQQRQRSLLGSLTEF